MKAVVLHDDVRKDARPDEKDVLVQADAVYCALTELGHHCVMIPFTLDAKKTVDALTDIRPDFVFNLVESVAGCGHLIHIAPSILDYLHIPYTGAKTDATFITSHKVLAKRRLEGMEMPTLPPFLPHAEQNTFIQGPYIIKAVWEHASIWLDEHSIIHPRHGTDLRRSILSRQKQLGMVCFAEPYIEGREFNLSLLAGMTGPEALPPAEIQFCDYPPDLAKVVDYRSKWVEDSFEYSHTPRCFDFPRADEPLLHRLTDLAMQCWHAFDLRGYARVDFRVDENNFPWILEINTNPCLSPDGGFAAAVERGGLTFNGTIERIVQDAMQMEDFLKDSERCGF